MLNLLQEMEIKKVPSLPITDMEQVIKSFLVEEKDLFTP